MNEINIDDLMQAEQTSEPAESQETEINIDDLETEAEQTNEVEVEEESEPTEESSEEVQPRNYEEIKINWDDESKPLSEYEDNDIQRLMGLGLKATQKIESARREAADKLSLFERIADKYGYDIDGLQEQLINTIMAHESNETGRHVDDLRKDFDAEGKSFKERNINRLLDANPDLSADEIPREVNDAIKLGKDATTAYETYKLNEQIKELQAQMNSLEKENKTLKQNEESRKKAFVKKKSGNTQAKESSLLESIDKILKS